MKKKAEDEEVKVDPKELLMKDLYVCMGNAGTTETDSWYATAKMVTEQTTTYTTVPCHSMERPLSSKRPTSARPTSAYSDPYNRSDSGMGSSIRSSAKNSSYTTLYQSRYSSNESEDDIMMSKLFGGECKPSTPRITDNLCVVNKDQDTNRPYSSIVYASPKSKSVELDDSELGIINDDGEDEEAKDKDDEKDSGKGDDESGESADSGTATESDNYKTVTVDDVDEVGAIIVGVVLKRVMKRLTNLEESDIENLPEIQDIFANKSYSHITLESLDKITFVEEGADKKTEEIKEDENEQKVSEQMQKNIEEESDVDSLLDSEEDFEETDTFFRKHKNRTYNLCDRKGVEEFKKFLRGTHGERSWKFWVDIDRMRLMLNEQEIQQ